ncbi:hypothetical protein [Streptoalloteichus hindustanus]|uniref:Uncharacterized protein n=1 Tax=Streptoalloteichus hindustanus TaxID=2017 RepID=A0A1M5AKM3_STRHI|nr:hypothetical protein [Streptoalloteichus hindustanus]SHF30828.1 hypothetical protein SAMN05444320_103167 [Streptoalloteichus hindustanus]
MWQRWLDKGADKDGEVFRGTYELAGDRLVLVGTARGVPEPVRLELARTPVTGER